MEIEYRAVLLEEARTKDPWELITSPTLLSSPVAPKKKQIVLITFLASLLFSSLISIILEKRKNIIFSLREMRSLTNWDILSQISIKDSKAFAKSYKYILENNLNESNDIGMNLRQGMYANRTLYIDIENHTFQEVNFDVTQLKLKKPLKLLDGIEKHPSRLMFRVNDFGVSQVGAAKSEVQPESELAVYQNKSYIRNNLLFSQSLSISIPLNTTLRAGLMVEVKFPVKKEEGNEGAETYGSDKTNDASGKYLISNLRHLVGGGMGETQLELIRDVFTA